MHCTSLEYFSLEKKNAILCSMLQKIGKGVQEGDKEGEGEEGTLYKARTFSYPSDHHSLVC